MDQLTRASVEFDAHHTDLSRVGCAKSHGHHWTATATAKTTADTVGLYEALSGVVSEWADRSIDEMLHVNGQSSPEKLAAMVTERLLMRFPTLLRVEVGFGRISGIIIRAND